ncbi:hypothetical protein KP509_19G002900 [Ceratopteris richardii]|uniref:Secreted protein n=1 Tax=Ceratopteris richardii TaxID=49495 RepID=A0A8T2SJC9_CERRI|nr:hypothetical protein KP509_19G002900 [Ceratopteris richardii]
MTMKFFFFFLSKSMASTSPRLDMYTRSDSHSFEVYSGMSDASLKQTLWGHLYLAYFFNESKVRTTVSKST